MFSNQIGARQPTTPIKVVVLPLLRGLSLQRFFLFPTFGLVRSERLPRLRAEVPYVLVKPGVGSTSSTEACGMAKAYQRNKQKKELLLSRVAFQPF